MMIQNIPTARPLVGHAKTPVTHGSAKHAKRHVKIAKDLGSFQCFNHQSFDKLLKEEKDTTFKRLSNY